jgi:uncharacterized protein GlcG (DUF336 family)
MARITLDQANTLIAAAFAFAADAKLKPLAAAVLDAGGHLIAFQRQDGASTGRLQLAVGKASGALFLGISSRKIADMAAERPVFVASLAPIAPGGVVPAAGGILVVDSDNMPIGAVGISGDISDNDERAVLAGIAAAGLAVQA